MPSAILFVALGAVGRAFSDSGTLNVARSESMAFAMVFGVMLGTGLVIVAARPQPVSRAGKP